MPETARLNLALRPFARRMRTQRSLEWCAWTGVVCLPMMSMAWVRWPHWTWVIVVLWAFVTALAWAWPLEPGRVARGVDRASGTFATVDTALHLAAVGHPAARAVTLDALDGLSEAAPPGLAHPRAGWIFVAGALCAVGIALWLPESALPAEIPVVEDRDRLAEIEATAVLSGDVALAEAAADLRSELGASGSDQPDPTDEFATLSTEPLERPADVSALAASVEQLMESSDPVQRARGAQLRERLSEFERVRDQGNRLLRSLEDRDGLRTVKRTEPLMDTARPLRDAYQKFLEKYADSMRGQMGFAMEGFSPDRVDEPQIAPPETTREDVPELRMWHEFIHPYNLEASMAHEKAMDGAAPAITQGRGNAGRITLDAPGEVGGGSGSADPDAGPVGSTPGAGGAASQISGVFRPGDIQPGQRAAMLDRVSRAAVLSGPDGHLGTAFRPYFDEVEQTLTEEGIPPEMKQMVRSYFAGMEDRR